MNLYITRCTRCGLKLFPERYFCPSCGGSDWVRDIVESGTVMESTVVRHRAGEADMQAVSLATVQTDEGPMVIAHTEAPVVQGERVRLLIDERQRIVALSADPTMLRLPMPSGK